MSFVKVRAARAALERAVAVARRRSIVDAVNYYTDRWGKEMGLRDSRNESSQNLNDAIEQQYWKNLANTDQTAQGVGNMIILAEMWRADRLKKKALKNDLAVGAAAARMSYLGQALNDPEKYPPQIAELGYLAIVQDVKRNKSAGKLVTARDHIEYSDGSGRIQFSCSALTGASAGSNIHISYKEQGKHKSLVLNTMSKRKTAGHHDKGTELAGSQAVLGNIYLACPKLTE
jgi:hypothetical protein